MENSNRILKFRAWRTKRGGMFYLDKHGLMTNNSEQISLMTFLNDIEESAGKDNLGLVWMQFTGLKDKNGKEIYEDDITKNENGEIRLVKWRDYGFKLIPIYGAIGILTFAGGRKRENNNKQIEVIGNVWENGDLLK